MYSESNIDKFPNPFGIDKIVDCRIEEDGRQMFKVRWECTWEPVENFFGCEHFIDEFWSLVNKAKKCEAVAKQCKTFIHHQKQRQNVDHFQKLSDDDKADIQNLIGRTNATRLQSPSNLLSSDYVHNIPVDAAPAQNGICKNTSNASIDEKALINSDDENMENTDDDVEEDIQIDVSKGSIISGSVLKYLKDFDSPYVKVIVACKNCNKEHIMKRPDNWKRHYMTHLTDSEKPHKCMMCPKSFVAIYQLKRHMQQHLKNENGTLKMETGVVQ